MADKDPFKNDSRNPRGKEPNLNWRGLLILGVLLSLIVVLVSQWKLGGKVNKLSYEEFVEKLKADEIVTNPPDKSLKIVRDHIQGEEYISGFLKAEPPVEGDKTAKPRPFRTIINLDYFRNDDSEDSLSAIFKEKKIKPNFGESPKSIFNSPFIHILMFMLLLLVLYLFFRHQLRSAGRGAMSFGKSRAKMLTMDKNRITFKDVAGVEEAKEEVWELVEFLRDPKKFQKLGGSIPKGVLMVGPPGTGKTLLARAIAGEADVPFFSISGSDFVEMFVGVGASRVRDMFEQGKKQSPCLIFIDEIDAVGRHRGHGLGGGHDEREQTLNALLVEMDGFDTQEGVIIIAATNRPDVLDPALLRPGRFDRQVTVNLPDIKGREAILEVHARKVKMTDSVDLSVVARGTPGFSGAELANLINEAALLAARKGLKGVGIAELEEARDKVRWGRERRSMAISEKEKEVTAYHEAGHAILMLALDNTEPLHKVTIIPRGPYMGAAMWLPQEDKYQIRRNESLDQLVVDMGGRVAEEIIFGDVTSGASGDIRMATNLAKRMVCEWGMSDELGMVEYGESQQPVFLAKEISRARDYSEATQQKIDREIKRLIDEAYQKAKSILLEKRDTLEAVAKGLLEFETLDAKHIREIMEHGSIQNPPAGPEPPQLPPSADKDKKSSATESTDDELPGGLTGAPAGA